MRSFLISVLAVIGFAGAAQACPNWSLSPNYGEFSVSGQQMRRMQTLNLTAGGDQYVWNCPNVNPRTDRGAGYFTSAPDVRIFANGLSGYQLVISMVGNCDTALLINTQSASWYYDDDDNGNYQPRIVLTRPLDGQIDIWAGTYDGQYCDAQLQLETFRR